MATLMRQIEFKASKETNISTVVNENKVWTLCNI